MAPGPIALNRPPDHGRAVYVYPRDVANGLIFGMLSNFAQIPVPDCGWLRLSAPGLGTCS
jgi:hypothetical protein